jgi:transposase
MHPSTIGADVSKDFLDVHRLADGASRRFANDKTGRKALLKWLIAAPVKSVVFEPTGPYHRALERALDAAGVPIGRSIPAKRAVSPRRPASSSNRSRRRRHARAHGRGSRPRTTALRQPDHR